MASRTCDLVERVHPAHQFDLDALLRYASSHVHTFPRSPSKFSVSQFGHGQSNPTFLLEASSSSSVKQYVLRKKPHGKLLESTHAVEREFQVSPNYPDEFLTSITGSYTLDPYRAGYICELYYLWYQARQLWTIWKAIH